MRKLRVLDYKEHPYPETLRPHAEHGRTWLEDEFKLESTTVEKIKFDDIDDRPWYCHYLFCPWFPNALDIADNGGFLSIFPKGIVEKINKSGFLLIDNSLESETYDVFSNLYRYLIQSGVDMKRVIYIASSLSIFDDNDSFCQTYKIADKMNCVNSLGWETECTYFNGPPQTYDPTKFTNRPKKYLMLNRVLRMHRPAFVSLLAENNILDDGIVSLFTDDGTNWDLKEQLDNFTSTLVDEELKKTIYTGYDKIKDKLPLVVDKTDGAVNYAADYGAVNLHQTSYFSLVSTTFYNERFKTAHINEKHYKPIAYKQPFIYLATPGAIKYLKDYGFKTFSKWIDESYDDIKDDGKRAEAIIAEAVRLSKIDNKTWDMMIKDMNPTLEHNYNRLFFNHEESVVKSKFRTMLDLLEHGK